MPQLFFPNELLNTTREETSDEAFCYATLLIHFHSSTVEQDQTSISLLPHMRLRSLIHFSESVHSEGLKIDSLICFTSLIQASVI